MIKDIMVEGPDRVGKNSLIEGLLHHLGFFQEVHYQKPRVLAAYLDAPTELSVSADRAIELARAAERAAMRKYQEASFNQMFAMMSQPGRYLFNRGHLGEVVYSGRYRGYDGSYVFDMERRFTHDHGSKFAETTLLVLLTASDFSFVEDDGMSFDFSRREEEQEDFKRAFDRSTIKNKITVDVSNHGGYRPRSEILAEVVEAYEKA